MGGVEKLAISVASGKLKARSTVKEMHQREDEYFAILWWEV